MQLIIKIVSQRNKVLLYLEEVEIEDASKINIDWLINIKELQNIESDSKSVAIDDTSDISFSEKAFFSIDIRKLAQKEDSFKENYSPIVLVDLNTHISDKNDNSQDTTDQEAQSS